MIGAVGASVLVLAAILIGLSAFSTPSNLPSDVSIDALVTVTGGGSQTTPVLSTIGSSDLIVAMVSTQYEQSIIVNGGSLSWTRVLRYTGTSTTAGEDIEVWAARVQGAHSHLRVTSTTTGPAPWVQSLTVMALNGATGLDAAAEGCYSTAGCTSNSPVPSVSLVPRQTGSLVIGVGYDYSDYIPKSVSHNERLDQQALDPKERATTWVEHLLALSTAGSPVTVDATASANDNWALVAFEVTSNHGSSESLGMPPLSTSNPTTTSQPLVVIPPAPSTTQPAPETAPLTSQVTSPPLAPPTVTSPPRSPVTTRPAAPVTTRPVRPPVTATPSSGCYVDPEGNCYRAGEFCPDALHGQTVRGESGLIICEDNDGWRWEPA